MLHVNRLSKTFTIHNLGGKSIEGFRDVSFQLCQGEFLGLSGPSGSGKSSVLKCIYRTYLPTSGEVAYTPDDGESVRLESMPEQDFLRLRHREIGHVSQFLRVIPRVSALDVVAEPLLRRGMAPLQARTRARALLERLRIPFYLFDAYPATFSGGEQQRINIARAVIWTPRLLLIDEPTASLDKGSEKIVIEMLRELKQTGTSMIGIFHDRELMQSVADRVLVLGNGSVPHGRA